MSPGEDEDDHDHDSFLARMAAEDAHADADALNSSGKGSADADVNLYDWELSRARRRRIALGGAVVVATVVVPLLYLFLSGDLRGIHHRPGPIAAVPSAGANRGAGNAKSNAHPGPLTPEQKRQAAVAADLHDYLWNGIAKLTPTEQPILKAYQSATRKKYADDAKSFEIIRTQVVPPYQNFVRQASLLKPKTDEVRQLQALFFNSIELRLLGYEHIAAAEHAKENTWRLTVGAELQASDTASERFKNAALDMAQRLDVPLPNQ